MYTYIVSFKVKEGEGISSSPSFFNNKNKYNEFK